MQRSGQKPDENDAILNTNQGKNGTARSELQKKGALKTTSLGRVCKRRRQKILNTRQNARAKKPENTISRESINKNRQKLNLTA